MPLEKKIMNVGGSKLITIPKSWIENAERTKGKKVIAIGMEIDGSIKLTPIYEKEVKA